MTGLLLEYRDDQLALVLREKKWRDTRDYFIERARIVPGEVEDYLTKALKAEVHRAVLAKQIEEMR